MKKATFSQALPILLFLTTCFFSKAQDIGNAPDWKWVQSIGGSGNDSGNDVAVDANGNVYVAGIFNGAMKIGSFQLQSVGQNDGYVAKFSPNGTALWVQQIKTNSPDGEVFCQNVAVDNAGNVIVSGYFKLGDLVIGNLVGALQSLNFSDLFVAKFSSDGDQSWLRTRAESQSSLWTIDQAVDDAGNIYCLGNYQLLKYNALGAFVWAQAYPYTFDSGSVFWHNGKLFLGSTFTGDVVIGGTLLSATEEAIYVCSVDPISGDYSDASKVLESNYFFGGNLELESMVVNGTEEIYLAGQFTEDLSGGACSVQTFEQAKGFVAKLGSSGCAWLLSESTSVIGQNTVQKIALDANGNLYACGNTNTGAVTFGGVFLPEGSNGYLAKIEAATGTVLSLVGSDFINSMALDGAGQLHETGWRGAGAYVKKSDSGGLAVFDNAFENDGGFCRVSSVESDDTGIYVMASVLGKVKLGNQILDLPASSMLIAKLSLDGSQVLWHRTVEGLEGIYLSWGGSVSRIDKANGKFYCGGVFSNTFSYNGQTYTNPNTDGNSYALLQISSDGSPGWSKVFSSIEYLLNVTTDNAGNVILGGTFANTASFGNISLTEKGFSDFFILKLDANGNELWAKRGGGNDTEYSVIPSTDAQNNIYFVSETYSLDIDFNDSWSLSTMDGDGNVLFGRLTPNGDLSWAKVLGKSAASEFNCFATGLKTDPLGSSYVFGFFGRSNEIGDVTLTSPYSLNNFVAKFDSDGATQWVSPIKTKRLVIPYYETDIDEAGNAYFALQMRDSTFIENHVLVRKGSPLARNFLITRFNNADGSLDWAKVMSGGFEAAGVPTAMAVHDQNSMICAGTVVDRMEFDAFQVNGYSGNTGFVGLLGTEIMVAVETPSAGETALLLSPNPTAGLTTLGAKNNVEGPVTVSIADSQGKVVFQQEFQGIVGQQQVDLRHLAPGLYFLHVKAAHTAEFKQLVIAR